MNGDRRPFTITQVRRADGIWRARVTVNGNGFDVDRTYGSWRVTPAHEGDREQGVSMSLATALQEKVRPIENAERVEREKALKAGRQAPVIEDWPPAEPNPFLAGIVDEGNYIKVDALRTGEQAEASPAPVPPPPQQNVNKRAAELGVSIG